MQKPICKGSALANLSAGFSHAVLERLQARQRLYRLDVDALTGSEALIRVRAFGSHHLYLHILSLITRNMHSDQMAINLLTRLIL